MSKQEVQNIKISDLHLWTENPRDPIDPSSSDYDVLKRAIADNPTKWDLQKLIQEMGNYYDLSEIPTVVNLDGKLVVYDGNRRVAVLKYLQDQDLYSRLGGGLFFREEPNEFRELTVIPCNVCDEETALTNIERKHSSNGSWGILEREYFLHRYRGKSKSLFLSIDEQTKLISKNPSLNKRFVRDEVLTKKNLNEIGFDFDSENGIISNYHKEAEEIISKIPSLIEDKKVTTRENRGELKSILLEKYPELEEKVRAFNPLGKIEVLRGESVPFQGSIRKTRIKKTPDILFGRTLSLEGGVVNNLYCALTDIDSRNRKSDNILPILGMSLRLLVEIAARVYYDRSGDAKKAAKDKVCEDFLKVAKSSLKQDQKNLLGLTGEWISGNRNLGAVLDKYAHGTIVYQREGILKESFVVADILEYFFKKKQ